jgi:hypothetical protein
MGQKHLIHKSNRKVGTLQIFRAVSMKITAFCHIAPCNLVEVDRRFRGAYCLHNQGDDSLISQKAVICNLGILQRS